MSGKTKTNLYLDLALLAAFLAAMEPALTGLALHEWLGLALGGALLAHLLLHWKWLAAVVRRFFQSLAWQARLNFILNTALLAAFSLIIVSGLLISETLGAAQLLGIGGNAGRTWREIHFTISHLALVLVGLHLALHWS